MPKIKPKTAKETELLIPAAIQIKAVGKKAKNDPPIITATKSKFKSIKTTPTSKETKK